MIEKTIHVSVRDGYDVHIGTGLLLETGPLFAQLFPGSKAMIITDSNVSELYLHTAEESLLDAGVTCHSHIFPAGEKNKNLSNYGKMLQALAGKQFTRSDVVIALGGGVCGDMAGFAAGTYMRGIRFVQIPTTVLSMVDSSVGGKCAVDLPEGKNLAGVFHQPSLVICDINTLDSLPEDVFADGMAEAVKTGILSGEDLFQLCENYSPAHLSEIIAMCIEYKAGVVERDETEQGERKLLNLGHTAGHAIELCSGYSVMHGHAVAAGTAVMCRACYKLGRSDNLSARVEKALLNFGLPTNTGFTPEQLLNSAKMDKKSQGNSISVIIPESVGKCSVISVDYSELLSIFEKGIK